MYAVSALVSCCVNRLTGCALCFQEEMKEFQERLDIERQIWEENYKKEKVC